MCKPLAFVIVFLMFFTDATDAQTKAVVIPGQPGDIFSHHKKDNTLFFFTGAENNWQGRNLYRMNLDNHKSELLDSAIQYGQSIRFTENGVFYISFHYLQNGNDGEHRLHFRSFDNTIVWEKVINQYFQNHWQRPSNILISENRFFTFSYLNGKYHIIESDGTEIGTKSIYNSSSTFEFIQFKNQIYISTTTQNYSKLKTFNGTTVIDQFSYISYQDEDILMIVKNKKLYFTQDLVSFDSSTYSNLPLNKVQIIYHNDSLLTGIHYNQFNEIQTYTIRKTAPYYYDSIPVSESIKNKGKYLTYGDLTFPYENATKPFKVFWSFKTGFEMMFIPEKDSIKLIADHKPGYSSSVFPNTYARFHVENSNTIYYTSSNGGNSQNYLHSSDGHKITCYFPVPIIGQNSAKFIYNNVYHWSEFKKDSVYIYYRDLNDRDTQPPPLPNKPSHSLTDEWHRSVAPCNTTYPYSTSSNNPVLCHGIKTDHEGNVLVYGISRESNSLFKLRYSDTNSVNDMNGNLILVKYDTKGRVLWSGSYGNTGQDLSLLNSAFEVDNHGDVILFGLFNKTARFDSIEFNVNRNAMFCAKVSGKTGKVIWAKSFNEKFWGNDFSADGVVCDKENNIYLSLTYKNFIGSFGPFTLMSDRDPVNAMVKIDTDGEFIWAKNTATEWTDKYGYSRSLNYDPEQDALYDLISQGYYNWWASCKYAPFRSVVHKINTDGEIEETFNFAGDDLNSAICAIPSKGNQLFISGFYRNKLNFEKFSITSPSTGSNNCNSYENFTANLQLNSLKPTGLRGSDGYKFYPLDICKDDEYIYVIGSEINPQSKVYELCIRKYTHLGKVLAKRFLLTPAYDVFDFDHYQNLTVEGEFFYIGTNSSHRIAPYQNFVENNPGLSVYKLYKDKDWIPVEQFDIIQGASGIVIGPNPASNFINVQFISPEDYNNLDIYDLLGKKVLTVKLSQDTYQTIDLSTISSGMYVLSFTGNKTFSEKIVLGE